MGLVNLDKDKSYYKILASMLVGDKPDGIPEDFNYKELIKVVDTGRWFEWERTSADWYEQF